MTRRRRTDTPLAARSRWRKPKAKPAKRKAAKPAKRKAARPRKRKASTQAPAPASPPGVAPHVELGLEYARRVVAGEQVAGRLTQLACTRHLMDLERAGSEAFPYRFDVAAAERVCRFIELLPHIKGPKARTAETLHLEPWECFLVIVLFGWLHVETGRRRFRKAFVEIARGNGKSFLASAIDLYMLSADGEPGAEVYSAATTRDQAKIVWKVAHEIVKRCKRLREVVGVGLQAHVITHTASASTFVPLSSEDSNLDGLNPHCATIDELHAHKTRAIYDILETALGKRDQSLLFNITTAGVDTHGICYEVLTYVSDVLEGKFQDDSFFGLIYTIDEKDDWNDERVWVKANPNLGVSVSLEVLRGDAKKAERVPAARAAFRTKRLNVWARANAALFDYERWVALGNPDLRREAFKGQECIAALDLASKNDIAARVDTFRRFRSDGKPVFTCFARHYTNQGFVEDQRIPAVLGWLESGLFEVSDGDSTSQEQIEDDLVEDASKFELREVGLDLYQAVGMSQRLLARGLPAVEIPMTVKQLSEATKMLTDLILEGRIEHDGDPVLAWTIGNVVGHYDVKENVFPRKEKPEKKIDAAVALIMALSRWLKLGEEEMSDEPAVSFA